MFWVLIKIVSDITNLYKTNFLSCLSSAFNAILPNFDKSYNSYRR
ncbi:hypothetical protein C414_000080157 [Campylobacter jejuni subsp. jejuni 414]|nr:hypothetical protein C414_000080157 [Campylobacter jejuni subsp. jejuni 414]